MKKQHCRLDLDFSAGPKHLLPADSAAPVEHALLRATFALVRTLGGSSVIRLVRRIDNPTADASSAPRSSAGRYQPTHGMPSRPTILLLLGLAVAAYSQSLPQLGFMIDSSSTVRPVYGVPGSILVGNPTATGALSTACSRRLCLVKTDSEILSSSGTVSAPPGSAVFAIDEDVAFVYFPATGAFMRWHAGQLDPLNVQFPGEVLSMAANRGVLDVAIRLDAKVSIFTINDGSLLLKSVLKPARLVALLDRGILYTDQNGLVLRHPDETEVRFDVQDASAIFPLGNGYVEVQAGRSNYALRVDPGRERVFLLPEGGQ